ncbi:hypothetical protein ABW19_dt0209261 [Dactylella cylindrospora]|nr:hypothetical protein ABW19_dt0209261 [Dactylella cylindrospora]
MKIVATILTTLLTTSATATWVTDKTQINELRERQLNETLSLTKRTVGGIYICTDINWGGTCGYKVQPLNTCIHLDSPWAYSISSFGPDHGTACVIGKNCEASSTDKNIIRWSGSHDLRNQGMNDRIGSFKCFQVDTNGECFHSGDTMPYEFIQYSQNCNYCCGGCTRSGTSCCPDNINC